LDETEFTLEFNVLNGAKGTAPVADVILCGASWKKKIHVCAVQSEYGQ
jgi:hypothetical protein